MLLLRLVQLEQLVWLQLDNANVQLANLGRDVIRLNNNNNRTKLPLKQQLHLYQVQFLILNKNYLLLQFKQLLLNYQQ
jgi:hypothetical protein